MVLEFKLLRHREKRLGAVKAGKSYAVRQSDLEAFEAANATRKEPER
nr:MAG TPA: hypothetical protein [Caudoviricetes sp.]